MYLCMSCGEEAMCSPELDELRRGNDTIQARVAELEAQAQRSLQHLQAMADWCDELETEEGLDDEEFKALCVDLGQAISLLGGKRDVETK